MLLWTVLNSIPLLACLLAWWTELGGRNLGARLRIIGFRIGLSAATIGSVLLLIFSLYPVLTHTGMEAHDFASHAFWIPSAALGICSLPLSFLGFRLSRFIGIVSSISLLVMLYIVGLATSY